MRLLLDTHVILWWLDDSPSLSEATRKAIADGSNLVCISSVSIWEIVIKQALKKLVVPDDFRAVLAEEPFRFLDMTIDHAFAVRDLPDLHKDPFDRVLIAQCKVEDLTLVSKDSNMKRYGIPVLDA
jgi:PIN domain nuclease of toxin-antitoxin system